MFGEHSIIFTKNVYTGFLKEYAFLLYSYSSVTAGFYFVVPVLAISIINLIYWRLPFISDFFLWFLVLNIHNKIYPTLTGGEYLLNQLLFFNIFLSKQFKITTHWFNALKVWMHNFASIGIVIQVCFIYFVAGFTKISDTLWMQGNAVAISSSVTHFNMYNKITFTYDSPAATVLNYLILFYQLLFPLLIWFRKVKKPIIAFGIAFHLYIAFGMGLITFAVVMLIPYIYLWPLKEKNN